MGPDALALQSRGPGVPITLVQISGTGIWLGLDRQGVWTLGRLDGAVESSADSLPSSWVTILDTDENSLRAMLDSAAERFSFLPENLQRLIPIEDVLTMAVSTPAVDRDLDGEGRRGDRWSVSIIWTRSTTPPRVSVPSPPTRLLKSTETEGVP